METLCSSSVWVWITKSEPREGIAKLRLLLEAGCNLFATDSYGRTCAHHAAANCRGWELHFLLSMERACRERTPQQMERQETLLRARTTHGDNLLHVAATGGHVPIIRYLLTVWAGHKLNDNNNLGRTPLHEAAARGHDRIVKLLLKAGAAVAPVDLNGTRPLDLAVGKEATQLLQRAQEQIALMRYTSYKLCVLIVYQYTRYAY